MTYSDKIKKVVSPSQWTNLIWIILGVILIQTVIFPILALGRSEGIKEFDMYNL